MSSKPNHRLSKTRQGQRSHAKQRFQERFQLEMNRDRIHEIENNIISGKAVAIESKGGKTNYFVEVEGRLVIVGYDPATHRVATALPAEYIRKISPKMLVLAHFRLLRSEQERVIADITSGKARLVRHK